MGATTDYTDYTDGKVSAKVEIRNRILKATPNVFASGGTQGTQKDRSGFNSKLINSQKKLIFRAERMRPQRRGLNFNRSKRRERRGAGAV
jgi:hypothetical protein